jgi:hypothetical protein
VYFPIDRPVPVRPGDAIVADLHVIPPKAIGWSIRVERDGTEVARFRHSTLQGMLLTADDLRRMRPASVPVLTARGEARRTVLELCDGVRTLADVEAAVMARHAELFRSRASAAAFVSEVVTRYTR